MGNIILFKALRKDKPAVYIPPSFGVLIDDYKRLKKKLEIFYKAYKYQWFAENKPHGFDVQDIRLGGLMQRMKSCAERLQELCDGKIGSIEELEEKQLDITCYGKNFTRLEIGAYNSWALTATANMI